MEAGYEHTVIKQELDIEYDQPQWGTLVKPDPEENEVVINAGDGTSYVTVKMELEVEPTVLIPQTLPRAQARQSPLLSSGSIGGAPSAPDCTPFGMTRVKNESENVYERSADESDPAKTDEPSSRRRKSNAERQREYRQRQKDKNITEKKRKGKSNAERLREYGQKQKDKNIQQENKRCTKIESVAGTSGPIEYFPGSSRGSRRKTNAERQREYRRRQKDKNMQEEYKRQTEFEPVAGASGIVKNVQESSQDLQAEKSTNRQRPFGDKHNAEYYKLRQAVYSKTYRDKKKFEKFSNIQSEIQLTQKSHNFIAHKQVQVGLGADASGTVEYFPGSSRKSQRKTNAERQREYRQRQKDKNIPEKNRKGKSNAERLREYRQKQKDKNIQRESKRQTQFESVAGDSGILENVQESSQDLQEEKNSNRQKRFRDTHNTEYYKLRQAFYSKAYRDKKKFKKFSNIESEIQLSQKAQNFIPHRRVQVGFVAETSDTIQNVAISSRESQSQPGRENSQVGRESNIEVDKHKDFGNEMHGYQFEGKIDYDKSEEEENSDNECNERRPLRRPNRKEDNDHIEIQEPNVLHRPNQNDIHQTATSTGEIGNQVDTAVNKYKHYDRHVAARVQFHQQFLQNPFGHACKICDRLWFKNDLKLVKGFEDILRQIIENYQAGATVAVCSTCYISIKRNKIPNLSTYNGFKYHDLPTHLPKLDIISERLISPQLPFVQIKRLRHYGQPEQYKFYCQVINVPVEVNNMVRNLPRDLNDENSIYIHIKKKLIHKNCYIRGLVNKENIKIWLSFLVNTPLYREYGIKINENYFDNVEMQSYDDRKVVSEHIPIEETLTARQQTLLWDEGKLLGVATGKEKRLVSLLFEEHAEELSFPAIYLGQFRNYKITVTAFMQVTSELRRADRRGATPNHVLYLAMKMMRLRVRDSLTIASKLTVGSDSITKGQIMESDYINTFMESNLAFLKSIPNSTWYWSGCKRDLFALIRQLGKPTAFMTLSVNEIKWIPLLKILYKLKNSGDEICTEATEQLHPMERSDLVNGDPVTCAIYFNKLVNVLMAILMSKRNSPFGKYHVVHFFKRIEFQNAGTPHAHILLWLNNAPSDVLYKNYNDAIEMIDSLSSVSASEGSGHMKLNTHQHTDMCYNKVRSQQYKKCKYEGPFMPSRQTVILSPMDKDDEHYSTYRKQYADIRRNLESHSYTDIDDFYNQNNIISDQHYNNMLRAGIDRPRVYMKRLPSETWHNPFNPFVFNLLQSYTDFQFILEEHSCAQHVVEYVYKTDRGISDLQKKIIQLMDEHPEFDIVEITRKMGVEMLNTVEMSSQEAAWYLLREPMSKSSTVIVYIPTEPPGERQKIRKTMEESDTLDTSTDSWKENLFDKYEKRPEYLNEISLAQFVSKYYKKINNSQYVQRKHPKIIRYRNYDLTENFNDYRREMVTLHIPFRNEQEEILLNNRYINTYDDNKDVILEKRKEFESDFDIEKMVTICRQLCRDSNEGPDGDPEVVGIIK